MKFWQSNLTQKSQQWLKTIPTGGVTLDGLKILAMLLMVIDHVNYVLLDSNVPLMWLMGRLVFPLFCFVMAIHFLRGLDEKQTRRYTARLLFWAVLSQPFFHWAMVGQIHSDQTFYGLANDFVVGNVIFTLALACLITDWLDRQKIQIQMIIFFAACSLTFLPDVLEYGAVGALLPFCFLQILRQRWQGVFFSVIALFLLNVQHDSDLIAQWPDFAFVMIVMIVGLVFCVQIMRQAEIKGKQPQATKKSILPRYTFYLFYPCHLMILALIRYLT